MRVASKHNRATKRVSESALPVLTCRLAPLPQPSSTEDPVAVNGLSRFHKLTGFPFFYPSSACALPMWVVRKSP